MMNTQKRTLSRRAEAIAALCLIACLGALGLHAATQTTNFAPADATVGNARLLSLAITQYTLDYDERLPSTQNVAVFQKELRPYVTDPAVFVSRVTGKPFVPNPAISGQAVTALGSPAAVALFCDVLPPSTIPATVGFLDGHVERGGVVQGDPKTLSIQNAKALSLGVIQYVQDSDEKYPPMKTQAAFQTALLPYVKNSHLFIDPLNGKPFVPNSALSGVALATIDDPYHTIVFQSATPYQNGIPTIGYADGHVTPAPPQTESTQDASNLKRIGLATIQYTQDYDEKYPQTIDYAAFVDVLAPYTRDTTIFVSPGSGLPYLLNPAISELNLAEISDPANTEEARDARLNFDGTLNHLELDGRVRQDAYFVPRFLAVDPEDQIRLLWPSASQQAAVWTLAPSGITKTIYSQGNSTNTVGFSVGIDGDIRIVRGSSAFAPITGTATLDTLGMDGSLETSTRFGPYDGWTARLLATGTDNNSRLLWQKYDGTLALWTLSPDGDYLGSVALPRLGGGTPVGLAIGADGLTRLLWKTTRGTGKLWLIAETGRVVHSFEVAAPGAGYEPAGLGLGADGASRVLWSDGKDHATVVTLRANGSVASSVSFTLPGGGTTAQLAVGKAGDLRVLWEAADGSGQLQTLKANGQSVSVLGLTPYQ